MVGFVIIFFFIIKTAPDFQKELYIESGQNRKKTDKRKPEK